MAGLHCNGSSTSSSLRTVALSVTELTPESFAPYGQVLDPQPDGLVFGPHDAQLDLSRGIPRCVPTLPTLFCSHLVGQVFLAKPGFRIFVPV